MHASCACRQLESLKKRQCAQVDAIEKLAMLNTREVRTILHVLFQQGYLSMQELPRTADRTPSKTVFLYHVRFESALMQLRHDLCTAGGAFPIPSFSSWRPARLASPPTLCSHMFLLAPRATCV